MKIKLITGLLILSLIAVPLFAIACEEEEPTQPAQQEEEQPPAEEEEEGERNWWDEFGEPQYGGTITWRVDMYIPNFDTYSLPGGEKEIWLETLFQHDWTLDRDEWSFQTNFTPDEYWVGHLAERWEQTDPTTVTVYLRQGVHWQDIPPVNGREFTAYDVEAHYERILGKGDYTEPAPMYIGFTLNWESVTATDNYTVVFKFKKPSAMEFQNITDLMAYNMFEPPEVAQLAPPGGNMDPKYAIGTGPWILEEYVEGTSLTFSKNPDYWGYDERYPENQLPYADTLKMLIIPDIASALAGLRSGQIDIIAGETGQLSWQQAQALENTNPELEQAKLLSGAQAVAPRCDTAPFTDIRVRKALQLAINREDIARSYYGGTVDGIPCGVVSPTLSGYAFDYANWPQELKDEYGYNPDQARQLLAEAAADGVFEPNEYGGFDTNVILTPSRHDVQLMEAIKSYFLDIGVDMEISVKEMADFESFTNAGMHDQLVGAVGAQSVAPFLTITTFDSRDMRQFSFVNDPDYDALVDSFNAASDLAEAKRIRMEADKYAIERHWYIVVCPTATYNAWQPYLKGYSGESIHWGQGHTWARLWVETNT